MLVPTGKLIHLYHFGLGDLVSVDPTHASTTSMDVQHDLRSLLPAKAEKAFQNSHHKLHGSVVIVEQNHLVQRRLLEFRLGRFHGKAAIWIGRR